ncbi:MAG: membrane protein insertion efficiency factor YidD [Aquificae bacterium]|jgi:putative membrane protein insertion efficiency factor|nr:membrane protein insertion efficiency factor YidD [Aquificota bacterium]
MLVKFFIFLIRIYQKTLSPFLGHSCRYEPSCSNYAILALQKYGLIKGSLKAIWRILRCNPWSKGGVDYP